MTDTPATDADLTDAPPAKSLFLRGMGRLTRSQRRRLLRLQAWALLLLAYLVVAYAVLFPQDLRNPDSSYLVFAWIAFFLRTFTLHLGLALAFFALCIALSRQWRMLLATTPLLLFTLLPTAWQYRPKSPPPVTGETLKVMSVNLLAWNHNTAPTVAEILAEDPDVLVFQEYTNEWDEAIFPAVSARLPHAQRICLNDCFGTAIYSRFPFVGRVECYLPLAHALTPELRAVIAWQDRELAIYNLHLLPPGGIEATRETRDCFADLLGLLEQEKIPAIVCGDFNLTRDSAQADAFADLDIHDAHDIAGRGRGATWPSIGKLSHVPGIRLDHIYLTPELSATTSYTRPNHGSDHRPIVAEVGFRAATP